MNLFVLWMVNIVCERYAKVSFFNALNFKIRQEGGLDSALLTSYFIFINFVHGTIASAGKEVSVVRFWGWLNVALFFRQETLILRRDEKRRVHDEEANWSGDFGFVSRGLRRDGEAIGFLRA
jgi:hypothetical protein